MSETILNIFVMIGTIPAAISGAMLGIKKHMDFVGVAILGMVTAVGGGILRDLILGNTPPVAFRDPTYALTGIITSLLIFLPPVHHLFEHHLKIYNTLMLITDSIGLGAFTVVGVETAILFYPEGRLFMYVFVGALTGFGGGILRDLLAAEEPYILAKQHLYAIPCIFGALFCALLWSVIGDTLAMAFSAAFVCLLRLASAHFRWKLPRAM